MPRPEGADGLIGPDELGEDRRVQDRGEVPRFVDARRCRPVESILDDRPVVGKNGSCEVVAGFRIHHPDQGGGELCRELLVEVDPPEERELRGVAPVLLPGRLGAPPPLRKPRIAVDPIVRSRKELCAVVGDDCVGWWEQTEGQYVFPEKGRAHEDLLDNAAMVGEVPPRRLVERAAA